MSETRQELAKTPAPIRRRSDVREFEYTFEFLTPMFGGGVDPEANAGDPVTKIRGSSLRGQLRFWWRATQAARFETVEAMHKTESRIFGCAGGHPVADEAKGRSLSLRLDTSGLEVRPKDPGKEIEYFAFPLRNENGRGWKAQLAQMIGKFKLHLAFDKRATHEEIASVKAALWAFSCFGGLGARTRRGFGALRLLEGDLGKHDDELLQSDHIAHGQGPPPLVPVLSPASGARLVTISKTSADGAWQWLAGRLKAFRQGENVGRNLGTKHNRPGRSRWPEPDFIRHDLLGRYQGSTEHETRENEVRKAPRASFGMPIIFHFKDEREISDVTLSPCGKERWASPLILRPIAVGDRVFAGVLLLGNLPDLDQLGVEMRHGKDPIKLVPTHLTPSESNWPKSPLAPPSADPLEAFMKFCDPDYIP